MRGLIGSHGRSAAIDASSSAPSRARPTRKATFLLQLQRDAGNTAVSRLLAGSGRQEFAGRSPGPENSTVQRQPPPVDEFAAKGPQGQARDEINNALQTATRKLGQAIANRDSGAPLPPDVFTAYNRFFAGSSLSQLDLLKTRVEEALGWAPSIPFDLIPNPVPAGYRDSAVHVVALAKPGLLAAALQPPLSAGDTYIAIYPPWTAAAAPLRTAVIFHELFHFFPGVVHAPANAPTEPSFQNARAYQGLVGSLAGMSEPAGITAMFPP